jgi:hypothetical protein
VAGGKHDHKQHTRNESFYEKRRVKERGSKKQKRGMENYSLKYISFYIVFISEQLSFLQGIIIFLVVKKMLQKAE